MDLSNLPKPLLYASVAVFLLVVGYGAAKHVPGLNGSNEQNPNNQSSKTSDSKSVKVLVLDEESQQPIVGAKVIMDSEGGVDSDTTDNLGFFRVQIPTTDYVRIRLSKDGCKPFNQNINLLSNPDRPKQLMLKCSKTNTFKPNK
ncbi:carboxypeptidase-like regulatory domain-containing protein [Nostoc sp. DSM 114161]|uniref:carboxypeptidase-like regulatory domain-containing protein n=1 Tax=Nostoc sp. DSM 114161 TaxID=3440143 RepID=UPI0040461CE9